MILLLIIIMWVTTCWPYGFADSCSESELQTRSLSLSLLSFLTHGSKVRFHRCLHSPFSPGIESCSATHTDWLGRPSVMSQSVVIQSIRAFLSYKTDKRRQLSRQREGRKKSLVLCVSCSSEALNEMIAVLCPHRQASKKSSMFGKSEQLTRPPDAQDFLWIHTTSQKDFSASSPPSLFLSLSNSKTSGKSAVIFLSAAAGVSFCARDKRT